MKSWAFVDVDGTIVDSFDAQMACMNEILRKWGEVPLSKNDFFGLGRPLTDYFSEYISPKNDPKAIIKEYRGLYNEKYIKLTSLTPFANTAVQEIFSGFDRVSLYSSNDIMTVRQTLLFHKICYDELFASSDSGSLNKIDLLVGAKSEFQAGQFFVFGDSQIDYEAAINVDARFYAILIADHPFSSPGIFPDSIGVYNHLLDAARAALRDKLY